MAPESNWLIAWAEEGRTDIAVAACVGQSLTAATKCALSATIAEQCAATSATQRAQRDAANDEEDLEIVQPIGKMHLCGTVEILSLDRFNNSVDGVTN